jgi:predicted ATPase
MITKISISNFKKLEHISFSLSDCAVLIGPNNSGKTSILQAFCLWQTAVAHYISKQIHGELDENGYALMNRIELIGTPVEDSFALWTARKPNENNINTPITIRLNGKNKGIDWVCSAHFLFCNAETVYTYLEGDTTAATDLNIAFLGPTSAVSPSEDLLSKASIQRKMGEGLTNEVIRNICYKISETDKWFDFKNKLEFLFGFELQKPILYPKTGLLKMRYTENGVTHDIAQTGLGFRQTLSLLAHLYSNPQTVLLLDEPDAHQEIIRQRQIFRLINEIAATLGSQIIIASHSEIILNEAAKHANIIAIVENTVLEINKAENPQQYNAIQKALSEIGFDYARFFQAHQPTTTLPKF